MTLEFNRKRIDVRLFVYPLTTHLKDMLPMLLVLLLSVYVNLVKELFLFAPSPVVDYPCFSESECKGIAFP